MLKLNFVLKVIIGYQGSILETIKTIFVLLGYSLIFCKIQANNFVYYLDKNMCHIDFNLISWAGYVSLE